MLARNPLYGIHQWLLHLLSSPDIVYHVYFSHALPLLCCHASNKLIGECTPRISSTYSTILPPICLHYYTEIYLDILLSICYLQKRYFTLLLFSETLDKDPYADCRELSTLVLWISATLVFGILTVPLSTSNVWRGFDRGILIISVPG